MEIAVGCGESACAPRDADKGQLSSQGDEVEDFGPFDKEVVRYPEVAIKVAEALLAGRFDRGRCFCGTGIGTAMAANKVQGIRAAQCHDRFSTERARRPRKRKASSPARASSYAIILSQVV